MHASFLFNKCSIVRAGCLKVFTTSRVMHQLLFLEQLITFVIAYKVIYFVFQKFIFQR